MERVRDDWLKEAREGVESYRHVLENLAEGRETHNSRNGLEYEDYSRPGLSVEIPLFWGTF